MLPSASGGPPPGLSGDGPTPLVLDLRQIGRDDLAVAGGKGANLGELLRAGFPVPEGFVVTTAAYDRFVTHNRLAETVAWVLSTGDGVAIRRAFESAPIPSEVAQAVEAAYARLGKGPVAVRSSASAEDLPEAAFAGQHETFLNVLGEEALLGAVRRCWASLWTDRAIAYRARLGIEHWRVKMAVIVQRLVPAEVAGVLFTANPVTGARDEVVIDASPGLGEAVVAGLVTPDHFVLRRRWLGRWGWRIVEYRPGRWEVVIRPRAEGGTERIMSPVATAARPVLPERALGRLADLGVAIERFFGRPQDIEWAWAGGELFILQSRPITALPEPLRRPTRVQRFMAALVAELLPARPYPLEMTTWVATVYEFPRQVGALLGLSLPPLETLFVVEDGVVVRLRPRLPFRPTLGILLAPLRLLWLAWRYDSARWQADPLLGAALARARALETRDLRSLSWAALLETVREALAIAQMVIEIRRRYFARALLAVAGLRLLLALLRRSDLFGTLLFAGVETKTIETNRVLETLAERIRAEPALVEVFARYEAGALWAALERLPAGRIFLAELRAFLDKYGHRETGGTLQVLPPTWKEAPEVVLGLLQSLVRTGPRPQRPQPAWEEARDALLVHPLLRLPLLRAAFLWLLRQARSFTQFREDTRFYLTLPLPILRRALLECGRRLVEVGVLSVLEDVFYLTWSELERLREAWPPPPALVAEIQRRVLRRKVRWAALETIPLVDPRLLGQTAGEGEVLLRGLPGSPGVAEGPVCIVRDASEFGKLRAGDVLVAPYTTPAWTPLFQRAVAVVVDGGGPASHAAIVAREYGLPAVMATVDGTRRLVDGQWVRVDGTRGLVLAASPRQSAAKLALG